MGEVLLYLVRRRRFRVQEMRNDVSVCEERAGQRSLREGGTGLLEGDEWTGVAEIGVEPCK